MPGSLASRRASAREDADVRRPGPGTYTVAELARRAEVSRDQVRYYARIGLLRPLRDSRNNYKRFSSGDLARIRFIGRAKLLGFTLAEVRAILGDAERGDSPCPRVRGLIGARLEENRRWIDAALALQERLEAAMAQWERIPDAAPGGESICHLIESFREPDDGPPSGAGGR